MVNKQCVSLLRGSLLRGSLLYESLLRLPLLHCYNRQNKSDDPCSLPGGGERGGSRRRRGSKLLTLLLRSTGLEILRDGNQLRYCWCTIISTPRHQLYMYLLLTTATTTVKIRIAPMTSLWYCHWSLYSVGSIRRSLTNRTPNSTDVYIFDCAFLIVQIPNRTELVLNPCNLHLVSCAYWTVVLHHLNVRNCYTHSIRIAVPCMVQCQLLMQNCSLNIFVTMFVQAILPRLEAESLFLREGQIQFKFNQCWR